MVCVGFVLGDRNHLNCLLARGREPPLIKVNGVRSNCNLGKMHRCKTGRKNRLRKEKGIRSVKDFNREKF